MGQGLWGDAGADAAGILGKGRIAHVEETIFDLPVVARECEQGGGIAAFGGQVGNGIDDLARAEFLGLAASLDAADLLEAWPILLDSRRQGGPDGDAAHLDAPVALVGVLSTAKIRRIGPPVRRTRQGGED
jgi:hypothetical protein